jgi:F-type H+-transporting ATPase subunit b
MRTPIMAQQQPAATQSEVRHEGGQANFPPFAANTFPSQLLWLAISFGALYLIMARVALPKLGGLIEARKKRIAKDLEDAAAMQQKADAAAAAHEKMIAEARAKALATAQDARDKLAAETTAKRKSLEHELAAKLAAADEQIAATRAQAMSNVETIARDAASAIFERILGRAPDAEAIAQAVGSVKNA